MLTEKIIYQLQMPLTINHNPQEPVFYINNIKLKKMENLSGYMEIFSRKDYEFGGLTNCVFIDVGANTADSVLYAASQNHISKVYGYEPFPQIYYLATENILLNPNLATKIDFYNTGWSDKNIVCPIAEVNNINDSAVNTVVQEFANIIVRERSNVVPVRLRKSSECLQEIIAKHPDQPIILKMDNEGSEYDCFKDLDEHQLFEKIDIVLMEWHLKGYKPLTDILEKYNFIWFNENLSETTGLIRAYRRK